MTLFIQCTCAGDADISPLVWTAFFKNRSDKYCTDFECPKYYELVDDAKKTVCKDHKCTKDVCCDKKGEIPIEYLMVVECIITRLVQTKYLRIDAVAGITARRSK